MRHLILATSFSKRRLSTALGSELAADLVALGEEVEELGLPELDLPFCDGGASYGLPQVARFQEAISLADTVTLAVPIHNWDVGGGARNAVAMGGDAWKGKTIGIVCAAGGGASYMGVMGIANSLMLDYRCLIVPRFVYATGQCFEDGKVTDPAIHERLQGLARALCGFAAVARDLAGHLQ